MQLEPGLGVFYGTLPGNRSGLLYSCQGLYGATRTKSITAYVKNSTGQFMLLILTFKYWITKLNPSRFY